MRPRAAPLCAAAFLAMAPSAVAQSQERDPQLVRFTSERSAVRSGGRLTPECFTMLTAEIAPPAEGVEIRFRIADGSGEGRSAPAMLSRGIARTDKSGLARTFLLSSDAEEECGVEASLAPPAGEGGRAGLELRVRFRRAPAEGTVVASSSTPAPGQARREPLVSFRSGGALTLARYLADPAVEVRTAVKRTLVSIGREAVGALVEVASDPNFPPDARSLAARTLAEISDDEADDQLLALLAHPLPDVRAGAEDAVRRMRRERALPLAEAAALSAGPAVRASALRILLAHPEEAPPRLARAGLEDPAPLVRATAVWEVARSGKGAEITLARALSDESAFVRTVAAKAALFLGRRDAARGGKLGEVLARALRRALEDRRVEARCAAAKAIALREAGPETALSPLTRDVDPRVRRSVALALSWRSDVRSSLRLLRALGRDPDGAARKIALHAIAESSGEAEMDILIGMTSAAEPELRELAVRSLRRLTCLDFGWGRARTAPEREAVLGRWRGWWGSSRALRREEWLWQALELPGSGLQGMAGLELARLHSSGDPSLPGVRRREALVGSLRRIVAGPAEPGRAERHAAAGALVLLGDEKGLAALEADLRDARAYVRLSGARTLASAAGSAALRRYPMIVSEIARLLVDLLEDPSVAVRRSGSRALRGLTGKSFGFEPQAPLEHREIAVAEWRRWLSAPARLSAERAGGCPREAPGP